MKPRRIGIPRSLYFHSYRTLWVETFRALGHEVVLSPQTSREILERGLKGCVHDVCLPVKCAYGHVLHLKDEVDALFLPRLMSLRRGTYVCPKIVAFPDLVMGTMDGLPEVLAPEIDYRHGKTHPAALLAAGRTLGAGPLSVRAACGAGLAALSGASAARTGPGRARSRLARLWSYLTRRDVPSVRVEECAEVVHARQPGRVTLGVLGRRYVLADAVLSFDLIEKLRRQDVDVLTPESVPAAIADENVSHLPFDLYWTLVAETVGVARHWLRNSQVDGIIFLLSFECGPDSLIKILLEDVLRDFPSVPYCPLLVDEHAAESGFLTRLEAFLDIVRGTTVPAPAAARGRTPCCERPSVEV
jgi:predicted nucleotide-binding protein (sugar kinase/HSP70/actin superfamily)